MMGTAMSEKEEVKEEKVEPTPDEQAQADFLAGFNEDAPEPELPEPEPEKEPEPEPEKEPEPQAAKAPEPKPEAPDKYENRLRRVEGRIGAMNDQLTRLMHATEQQTKKAGGDTPSTADVLEASKSQEKLDELKKEFPEWGEALEDQVTRLRKQIPDADAIRETLRNELAPVLVAEARKLALIDLKHEGWEETVKSEDFETWFEAQDNATKELAASDSARDAIRLLDLYAAREDHPAPAADTAADEAEAQRQRRLRDAIPATKGSSRRERAPTPEEEFLAGFNSV